MCQACRSVRSSSSAREIDRRYLHKLEKLLQGLLGPEDQIEPRVLHRGVFSDPFEMLGKRYVWVMEGERLVLQPVTWSERDEE
jgi:hypothetical protein